MGFPLGYSELLLPKLLLQLVFFLGLIRRLISWAFNLAGLGDLLDSDTPWPDPTAINLNLNHHHHHHHHHNHNHNHNHPQFHSVSALLIQETLPVIKFKDLQDSIATDSCAVCLYDFEDEDEVRRLSNCRHVFHRSCLDRWMEHDQRTCPLCRTTLVPEEMQDSFNDKMWAAAGLPDSYSAEFENLSALYYSPALSFGRQFS